jgi:DNA invertase Pin-like site-specific DNA recombinase
MHNENAIRQLKRTIQMFEQPEDRKVAAYLRVSTADQDNANQETGVLHYATLHSLTITQTYRDTASTRLPWAERLIGQVLTDIDENSILLVAEISRLARSTLEVLQIAAAAAQRDITIIATKSNLILNGSLESKITTTILGLAAEIEREFIRSRTKEALARAKASGKKLGRPTGSAGTNKLDGREAEIIKYMKKDVAKTSIAKLLDVSRGTLETKLERMQAQNTDLLTKDLI